MPFDFNTNDLNDIESPIYPNDDEAKNDKIYELVNTTLEIKSYCIT